MDKRVTIHQERLRKRWREYDVDKILPALIKLHFVEISARYL